MGAAGLQGSGAMNETVHQLVRQVKEHLLKLYGDKIKQVILYGSQARGEATEDSDVDVLVVVDDSLDLPAVRNSLSDLLFDFLLETNELISVIAIPEQLFNTYNSPFLLTVKEEGVVA
jgi:predicted nucleotidyltransferase